MILKITGYFLDKTLYVRLYTARPFPIVNVHFDTGSLCIFKYVKQHVSMQCLDDYYES